MSTSTNLRAAIDEIRDGLVLPEQEMRQVGEQLDENYQQRALERLYQRLGAMPWWVISGGLHTVLFLLVGLLAVAVPAPIKEQEVIIVRDIQREQPPKYVETSRPVFEKPTNSKIVDASVAMPVPVDKPDEAENTPDKFNDLTPRGDPSGLAFMDESPALPGVMGVSGFNEGAGAGKPFGIRTDRGGKAKLMHRYGGDGTEAIVESALNWLARHQEADGRWDCGKYGGSEKKAGDVGVTGLALLAFLGSGYTGKSGRHAETVRRAEEWLMKQQKPNGAISCLASDGRLGYNHAIAGLALAEAYGMEEDPRLGQAAQKAVDYSIREHQSKYSGWRYAPKQAGDISVTGWFVMQLKSARMARLSVDGAGLQGAASFLDAVTTRDGYVGYTKAEGRDTCMTAVGMVCRQFIGMPHDSPVLKAGAGIVGKALPEWGDARGHGREKGFYYWYYGTLATFQMGGEGWARWNARLKPTLVEHQCKGGPTDGTAADTDGSWDPTSWIDKHGGRVFTTAMGALTLEVYYRYLPMYGK